MQRAHTHTLREIRTLGKPSYVWKTRIRSHSYSGFLPLRKEIHGAARDDGTQLTGRRTDQIWYEEHKNNSKAPRTMWGECGVKFTIMEVFPASRHARVTNLALVAASTRCGSHLSHRLFIFIYSLKSSSLFMDVGVGERPHVLPSCCHGCPDF